MKSPLAQRQQLQFPRMQMQIFAALNLYGRTNYVLIAHPMLTIIDGAHPRVEAHSTTLLVCAHTSARLLHVRVEG